MLTTFEALFAMPAGAGGSARCSREVRGRRRWPGSSTTTPAPAAPRCAPTWDTRSGRSGRPRRRTAHEPSVGAARVARDRAASALLPRCHPRYPSTHELELAPVKLRDPEDHAVVG